MKSWLRAWPTPWGGGGGTHILRHTGVCHSNGSLFRGKIPLSLKFSGVAKNGLYIEKNPPNDPKWIGVLRLQRHTPVQTKSEYRPPPPPVTYSLWVFLCVSLLSVCLLSLTHTNSLSLSLSLSLLSLSLSLSLPGSISSVCWLVSVSSHSLQIHVFYYVVPKALCIVFIHFM